MDWIDRVPRRLQFVPARLQEFSFAWNAASRVRRGDWVLSRELETAWLLTRKSRRGVFLELHRMPAGRLRRGLLSKALPRLSGIIAISEGVHEELLALGAPPERTCVAHDGYAEERFRSLPSQVEARAELGLNHDRPTVVYTGGLLTWKGVDVLVDAARSLPEVQFVIAGGMDADVARLRDRAQGLDHVRLDGFQAPERVALYLAAGDLGVVPNRSRPEISARFTSPLKIYESMAAGLPLVVSDLPSMRSILTSDEAYFVAPDEPAALAEGLRLALADRPGREAKAARLHALAGGHTWDARARRLLAWMGERVA